jgi:hypothetical protein
MKDGDVTRATCPTSGCQHKLIYQMEGPIRLEGGLPITVPVERHFYRCPEHGLFRFRGEYFVRVEK